jgi:hypothetical protein
LKKYPVQVFLAALTCVLSLVVASVSWAAAIAISNTQELVFGKFATGSGGSIIVSPAGARSASGGVVLLPSSSGIAAQFSVSGDASATYTISLPDDGTVSLASGANSMAVNTFTSSPSPTGTLGAGGTQTLSVGATLTVSGNQPIGSYSGAFVVTVDYN